jgi:VWFA-related protein
MTRPLCAAGRIARAAIAAVLLAAIPLIAQQNGAAPQKKPIFEAQSTVVLLDIVVRDKKGNPVRDLRPDEVKVSEDGMPRDLTAFRLVEGQVSDDRITGPMPAGLQPDPSRQVSLVTMVFDKVLDNRHLSKQAALDFVANNMQSNVWISVFSIDQRLYLRQPFTQDPYLVKQAINAATGSISVAAASLSGQASLEEQHAKEAKSIAEQAEAGAPGTASAVGGPNAGVIGAASAEAQMAQVIAATLRFSDSIQRQQQGQSSLYPLLSMVKAQGRLTGRKTIIYFAEGLVVPKNLEEVFKTTISEANRANVTIYGIDARGLNSSRDSEASQSQLLKAARDSQLQAAKRGGGAVTVDEVLIAENAEESLRANVQDTLGELAQSTGGFLTANTNDFKPNMQRIAADIGSYYEAAYVPVNPEFDGKFRKITVKVTRPGVTVQSRSGYFALPPGEGSALLPYEMPLLTALTVDPPPHAFEYQAAAFQFGRSAEGREHVLMFEVPLEKMTFEEDTKKKTYRLRFSLLALVRDADGHVVERFSDDYPFEGPLNNLDNLRRGNLIFKRQFTLKPGQYTIDYVAQDRDSGRTSVEKASLLVPADANCAVSTVSVIRRLEEAGPEMPANDPLRLDRMRVVPNFDLPISKAQNKNLSVYVVIYATPGATTAPKMALEFMQGDRLIARAMPALGAPDKEGRIPFVGTIPIEAVPAGQYSVRALVQEGNDVAESETPVTLVP